MKRGSQPLLAVEALALVRGGEVIGVEQPQRDLAPQRELRGLVDGARVAGADQGVDPKAADRGPGREGRAGYPTNSRNPSPTVTLWKITRPEFGFTHHTSASP